MFFSLYLILPHECKSSFLMPLFLIILFYYLRYFVNNLDSIFNLNLRKEQWILNLYDTLIKENQWKENKEMERICVLIIANIICMVG